MPRSQGFQLGSRRRTTTWSTAVSRIPAANGATQRLRRRTSVTIDEAPIPVSAASPGASSAV